MEPKEELLINNMIQECTQQIQKQLVQIHFTILKTKSRKLFNLVQISEILRSIKIEVL